MYVRRENNTKRANSGIIKIALPQNVFPEIHVNTSMNKHQIKILKF